MIKKPVVLTLIALAFVSELAHADPASVKKAVQAFVGNVPVDEVRATAYPGIYEVRIGSEVVYTDEKVTYIFSGNLIDTKTRANVTQARLQELSVIKFSELPLDLAVKTVRGKGRRVIATFEDPNCSYCRRFAEELQKVDDITVYTFLMPILSPDSVDKVRAVWCSADRSKAWNDLMLKGTAPAAAAADCKAPVDKVSQLGQRLRINGTPTIFLASGQRIPGMVRAEQLEEAFKTGKAK